MTEEQRFNGTLRTVANALAFAMVGIFVLVFCRLFFTLFFYGKFAAVHIGRNCCEATKKHGFCCFVSHLLLYSLTFVIALSLSLPLDVPHAVAWCFTVRRWVA